MRNLAIFTALLATLFTSAIQGAQARQPRVFTEKGFTKNIGPQPNPALRNADKWARFNVTIRTDKPVYKIGDLMRITITSERNCYIMVYYVNSRGDTSVICPSAFSSRRQVFAKRPFKLVDNKGQALQQNGPAGSETLQVVATDRPLDVATLSKLGQPIHTTAPAPAPSGNDGDFDDGASAPPTMQPEPVPTTVGDTTPISRDDEFVDDTSKAIERMVVSRSNGIAARYKNIGPTTRFRPQDGVYGLSSVTYKVKP